MGKIYPTAKQLGFVRSTVKNIVGQFTSAGFSEAPRPNVPEELLRQAQNLHLHEVKRALAEPHSFRLSKPTDYLHAADDQGHIIISESLTWHLKDVENAEVLAQTQIAVDDMLGRCNILWLGIAEELVNGVDIGLISVEDWNEDNQEPYLFDTLVDRLYRLQFSHSRTHESRFDGLRWTYREEQRILLEHHTFAATGDKQIVERVMAVTDTFVNQSFDEYSVRAFELERLYHDLQYLEPIIEESLSRVDESLVRQGICPMCPYPEVLLDSPGRVETN